MMRLFNTGLKIYDKEEEEEDFRYLDSYRYRDVRVVEIQSHEDIVKKQDVFRKGYVPASVSDPHSLYADPLYCKF
jgi:hypothetical protein